MHFALFDCIGKRLTGVLKIWIEKVTFHVYLSAYSDDLKFSDEKKIRNKENKSE